METKKEFEKLLSETLSTEEIKVPDVAFMYEARSRVLARKKKDVEHPRWIDMVFSFFNKELKLYHLGVSALLISGGAFYLNEPGYSNAGDAGLMGYHQEMSINNSTISVNSSTMLTSIPTLIIRN
jgi:hypothetical protein